MRQLALVLVSYALVLGACSSSPSLNGGAASASSKATQAPVKTVYHLSEGLDQASNALRNIGNHLSADPSVKIQVVTHSRGIDFLLAGAKDKNGGSFEHLVQDLAAKGVDFKVCQNTLDNRKLTVAQVIKDASIVPSGVAEVARLQSREGFAYLRP